VEYLKETSVVRAGSVTLCICLCTLPAHAAVGVLALIGILALCRCAIVTLLHNIAAKLAGTPWRWLLFFLSFGALLHAGLSFWLLALADIFPFVTYVSACLAWLVAAGLGQAVFDTMNYEG
jgi:hypothetical protein